MGTGGARSGAGRPARRPAESNYSKIDIRQMNIKQEGLLTVRWDGYEVSLGLTTTACGFGGVRWWFRSPCCGRRASVLFIMGYELRCVKCSRVSYDSQRVNAAGRAEIKQSKFEAKLIDGCERPKYMRFKTYETILTGIEECELVQDMALIAGMERMGIGL